MTDHQPGSVPKALRPARILLFAQAGFSILAGVFTVALVNASDANDQTGVGQLIVVALIGIALGAILLTCAVLIPRRLPWVRITVIVIEAVNGISGLIGLIYGIAVGSVQPMTVFPIVISAVVIQALVRAEVRAWFVGEQALLP